MRFVILADDLTGALDTGIQFAKIGIETGLYLDYKTLEVGLCQDEKAVYVVNTETRHSSKKEAYDILYEYTNLVMKYQVDVILKKTDSGLRGNIGSELAALMDATQKKSIPFVPAYPDMNRVTIDGIHYIDGTPVHKSVFGSDPFDPVHTSNVKELIQYKEMELHKVSTRNIKDNVNPKNGIQICDASSNEDIRNIVDNFYINNQLFVIAGCAALGEILVKKFYRSIGYEKQNQNNCRCNDLPEHFLVVCGSVNEVTRKQIEYATTKGFFRESFLIEDLVPYKELRDLEDQESQEIYNPNLHNSNIKLSSEMKQRLLMVKERCEAGIPCIIDTGLILKKELFDHHEEFIPRVELGKKVASKFGEVILFFMEQKIKAVIMIIGGDTLYGTINKLPHAKVILHDELESGVALCEVKTEKYQQFLITKSGGFGKEELVVLLKNRCLEKK